MAGDHVADPGAGPPDLSLTRLRVFAAVAEQGGYSAAARGLGLSQPTVSFHVRALERVFGTSLLVYAGRRVHLTPAGEALYALATRTLRDTAEVSAQIAALNAGHAGRVRLAASIAFEQAFFFASVMGPFARTHPGTEISLRFGTSRQMAEAVRVREADLAYVMRCPMPAGVRYLPLHRSRAEFFVAAGHPLAAHASPPAALVGAAGLITVPLDSVDWEYYSQALRAAGLRDYRIALEVSGIQARVLAAQAGMGVLAVFWPPYARRPELPGLRPVRISGGSPGGPEFGLAERAGDSGQRPAAALAAWLRRVTAAGTGM